MGGLRQSVIIRPQRLAAMVLSTGKVQGVGCPQSKAGTQLRGLQMHRLGHGQRYENPE